MALYYTKPTTNSIIPALLHPDTGQVIAATFEEKEALFREQAFPQALEIDADIDLPEPRNAYNLITELAV